MTRKLIRDLVTFVLLAAFILPAGSVHARLSDDDACEVGRVAHDPADHRIGGNRAPAQPAAEHCAVCHWWQSLRIVQTSSRTIAPADTTLALVPHVQTTVASVVVSSLRGRAPPA